MEWTSGLWASGRLPPLPLWLAQELPLNSGKKIDAFQVAGEGKDWAFDADSCVCEGGDLSATI